MQRERRTLKVADNIIQHLISKQAGTLGKAVLEAVMNSIDAGASSIQITFNSSQIVISDDGHGFRTREEVESFFEVFGFDHTNHKREFGEFGLGRGQIWNWVAALYRTNEFSFDVDIRTRGLDWDLTSGLPVQPGLEIIGTFYEPLKELERAELLSEIERLCKYSTVPVVVNGTQVSTDPSKSRWTVETEDAYLRVGEGYYLRVYNQGVHTCDLYTSQIGIAGVLVTKRGKSLKLNMARNDILRSQCELWKGLKAKLDEVAKSTLGARKTRMNEAQRDYIAKQTADPANAHLLNEPIITLCNNRHIGVYKFCSDVGQLRNGESLTVAESGNRMGDSMMRDKTAIVLAQATLDRFGASKVADLVTILLQRIPAGEWSANQLRRLKPEQIHESISTCPGYRRLQANTVPANELSAQQRLFLTAVAEMESSMNYVFSSMLSRNRAWRPVAIGRGEGIDGFTDGSSFTAIVDTFAHEACKDGLPGFLRVAHLIVHELLHDSDDSGSHQHDAEFYEQFHDIIRHSHNDLFRAATAAFKLYAKRAPKLSRTHAIQLDRLADSDAIAATA